MILALEDSLELLEFSRGGEVVGWDSRPREKRKESERVVAKTCVLVGLNTTTRSMLHTFNHHEDFGQDLMDMAWRGGEAEGEGRG